MKKLFLIRLALTGCIALLSLLLYQSARNNVKVAEQGIEEVSSGSPRSSGGEFLIWESVTRYMMASYN
jgi:hypothetical protein